MSQWAYETCYNFKKEYDQGHDVRSAKRRKIASPSGLHASWGLRRELYQSLWSQKEARMKDVLVTQDQETVLDLSTFIKDAPCSPNDEKVDTAILVSGPSLVTQSAIVSQLQALYRKAARQVLIPITASEATNLKAVLKRINAVASVAGPAEDDADDEDDEGGDRVISGRRGAKFLNYDLRILQQEVEVKRLDKVVIAFQDCEAIDGALISDLVDLFSYWKDRIPFILILGIATSIDTLQLKLSKRAIRRIRCRRFDVSDAQTTTERLFAEVNGAGTQIFLGRGICDMILSRQGDFLQNPRDIIDSVQYAYMTHMFANPASLFLDRQIGYRVPPKDHLEATRNLPSFRRHVEDLLHAGDKDGGLIKELLQSDATSVDHIKDQVAAGQATMQSLMSTASLYTSLTRTIMPNEKSPASHVTLDALSGSLLDQARYKTLFLRLKRANSTSLSTMIATATAGIDETLATSATNLQQRLTELLEQQDSDAPLRSEIEIQNSSVRTTVVAKKIALNRAQATLTEADIAYTAILNDFIDSLQEYFARSLIDPHSLPFNEIFLFDLKSPHRNVFMPRPRPAIERALSSPRDYLNCSCCGAEDEGLPEMDLSSAQPATAILYKLYLQGGMMINAADLRSAFESIMADKIEDEQMMSAVFERSLAELSYLGMVKGTKKRADHIVKLSWKGL